MGSFGENYKICFGKNGILGKKMGVWVGGKEEFKGRKRILKAAKKGFLSKKRF